MSDINSSTSYSKIAKTIKPFLYGGLSGMAATTAIQPIDMIKVRLQLVQGTSNPLVIASNIIKNEGFLSLYKGLSAGLLRQATYTTARMGLFKTFISQAEVYNGNKPASFAQRSAAGLAAGGLGAMIGTPADLALVRMQSDGLLPANQRQNYTGVFNTLGRIVRGEGLFALWNGCGPTVARAMALNFGMLTTHAESKQHLEKQFGASYATKFGASAIAGFFASFFSLPFDFVKTRLQRGQTNMTPLQMARHVLVTEGPLAFYRGFPTFYVRIAPHAMITLLVAETLSSFDKKAFAKAPSSAPQ